MTKKELQETINYLKGLNLSFEGQCCIDARNVLVALLDSQWHMENNNAIEYSIEREQASLDICVSMLGHILGSIKGKKLIQEMRQRTKEASRLCTH